MFGGGNGRGIERGLGRRGVISGSERVEWSVMERGRIVINLDIQRSGNTAGRDDVVANLNLIRTYYSALIAAVMG